MALNLPQPLERITAVNGTDDREACQRYWVAAYTRPKSERKAAAEIQKHRIETYVPVQSVVRQWSDRKKKVEVVIIPNILFAYLTDNDINTLGHHRLITKILTLPGSRTPAHIPSDQIDRLRFMLNEADSPVSFSQVPFKVNDTVRVTRGGLKGLVGSVERISESKSLLVVMVDLLGGAMVEIPTSDLESLTQ